MVFYIKNQIVALFEVWWKKVNALSVISAILNIQIAIFLWKSIDLVKYLGWVGYGKIMKTNAVAKGL